FLEGAKGHLKDNGRIILVSSSAANLRKLKEKIAEMGYAVLKEEKEHFFFEDIVVMLAGT
ncbi:MAG: hypothetical protein QXZ01_01220, partial [Candidatus Micrarchaeaceae archaeon]